MVKIEVEHRGLLTAKKFKELRCFFKKNGKFLGEKKRFSIIHNASKNSVREVSNDLIDLKLRITNKKAELALKHGRWSAKDARKEFNIPISAKNFFDMVEVIKILGYNRVALMANTKMDYRYNGIDFSLVKVPEWGYYFEAEILTDEKSQQKADLKVEQELEKFGLKALDEEKFYDLLDDLNGREGFKIDLNNVSAKELKARFAEYF